MKHNLTDAEKEILVMIYEGKGTYEISKMKDISIKVTHCSIVDIMHKTSSKTWEELKIIGAQIAHPTEETPLFDKDKIKFVNPDERTKEQIEAFCDWYDQLIKEHTTVCNKCYIAFTGFEFACPEHRRLLESKKDWMDKLIGDAIQ